jgi:hypothetical protein
MKLIFRIIVWVVLSGTHILGSIEFLGANYLAGIFIFIGKMMLYGPFLVA